MAGANPAMAGCIAVAKVGEQAPAVSTFCVQGARAYAMEGFKLADEFESRQ